MTSLGVMTAREVDGRAQSVAVEFIGIPEW